MKKAIATILFAAAIISCAGCKGSDDDLEKSKVSYPTFEYTHYASGGTKEQFKAVILFEQSNSTFTGYQVAFSSCTCRDSSANYYSVCYVELLNKKDKASIRAITFGDNKGLWGDSNPNHYISEYTQEYMNEHFVQSLVKVTKEEIDAWGGYGTQIDSVDADAVTGATVSTSNITSMLQGLFLYHEKNHCSSD